MTLHDPVIIALNLESTAAGMDNVRRLIDRHPRRASGGRSAGLI